ncbi:MAG TPA: carboxypeptidase-like regulatory domain-containing protein, partial [Gemmatimonadaceae bacterium]
VRVTINESDADPFQTSGRLERACWEGGGREAILLTSGFGVIGLTRELPVGRCRPTSKTMGSMYGELRSSQNNELLAGAFLRIYDQGSSDARDSTVTDQTGWFRFKNLPAGSYRIRASTIAHRVIVRELLVRAGITDTLRLVMPFDTTGMISDCMSPDGHSFGQQFCKF